MFESDVADFVDDEQPDPAQLGQFRGKSAGVVGGFESGDPVHCGGAGDWVSGLGGFMARPMARWVLPVPG